MTETTESLVIDLGMDEAEEALAGEIYDAIQWMTNNSVRSQQSQQFVVGVSDLGFCSERTRRMLVGDEPDDTDMMLAWIGTALGDHAEQAISKRFPGAIIQSEVEVELEGETRVYRINGHPDVIFPAQGILLDVKTDYGLTTIRRTGPSRQQQYQRHCYAKGAWEAGLFRQGLDLAEVQVANVWIDRSGIEKKVHVQMEPYNEDLVVEAAQWLDEVVYNYLESVKDPEVTARKEPPREMCAVVCGFYATCRAMDTDVSGLLTDQTVLTAVDMYREGLTLEKQGRKLKDEAKQHLQGISGSTGQFTIRWVHVNETELPPQIRRAHDKLDVRAIPQRKA